MTKPVNVVKIIDLLLSHFSRGRLCDPIDGSPPGSPVPGILQARILERVAISFSNACIHAKSLQSCLTLCDPMDSSPPGSPVHRILQARKQEWVAISFSQSSIQNNKNGQCCLMNFFETRGNVKWFSISVYIPSISSFFSCVIMVCWRSLFWVLKSWEM